MEYLIGAAALLGGFIVLVITLLLLASGIVTLVGGIGLLIFGPLATGQAIVGNVSEFTTRAVVISGIMFFFGVLFHDDGF